MDECIRLNRGMTVLASEIYVSQGGEKDDLTTLSVGESVRIGLEDVDSCSGITQWKMSVDNMLLLNNRRLPRTLLQDIR